jgi:ribonuclease HI
VSEVVLETDGASEPNPGGLATYGFVARGVDLHQTGKGVVGEGAGMTNNVAEWAAVERGLRWLTDNRPAGMTRLVIRGDSQLVQKQLTGVWGCKAAPLAEARDRCLALLDALGVDWAAEWVPREQNAEADALTVAAWVEAAGRPFPERPAWWRSNKSRA